MNQYLHKCDGYFHKYHKLPLDSPVCGTLQFKICNLRFICKNIASQTWTNICICDWYFHKYHKLPPDSPETLAECGTLQYANMHLKASLHKYCKLWFKDTHLIWNNHVCKFSRTPILCLCFPFFWHQKRNKYLMLALNLVLHPFFHSLVRRSLSVSCLVFQEGSSLFLNCPLLLPYHSAPKI